MKWNTVLIVLGLCCGNAAYAADEPLPDPTRPDFGESKAAPQQKKTAPKNTRLDKGLRLEQTIVSPMRRIAVINGKQYRMGSELRGARISKIESGYVLLNHFGEIYRLNLVPQINIREAAGK